jgi:hypothetical protein
MGNLVFRYFLEWLRVEMRQEVYTESIKRQRRRAENWKRQRIQQIQQKRTQASVESSEEGSGWSSYLPGWISEEDSKAPEDLQRKTDSQKDAEIDVDKESQLWELAKQEGDEKFFEWLEKHVWTVSVAWESSLGITAESRLTPANFALHSMLD